jgi:3-deoxy-D-manno-octulosonate 8-phosphate phosphatase (KDO 8-P phosphatase)
MPAYEEIVQKTGGLDSAVAYIGDDLPDLPVMRGAGLAIAVGNAVPEVKKAAHYTTKPSLPTARSAKPLSSSLPRCLWI